MTAETIVREYYEALRRGDPLAPFFAREGSAVKFGIEERPQGYDDIAAALERQTETTDEWRVDSTDLSVTERDGYAWFADVVGMAWTDTGTGERFTFDSRWSGTLEEHGGDWQFVSMHVSAPREL